MNDTAPRIHVTGGGRPTDPELAALVVALTPVQHDDQETDDVPGWRRAAILEGIGHRPVTSAADLHSHLDA